MNGKKLLIIGLDGVPFEMLRRFGREDDFPHLQQLLNRGRLVPMSASIPEISSVSWSSFMTGSDPGVHGIFGFVDLVPGTYRYRFPDFRDLRVPAFFDELGTVGKRSVIINLPATYPARAIPGVLISGFIAIDLEKSVYPSRLFPLLKKQGYQVDVDANKGKERKSEFLADLHYCLKVKKEMADLLWDSESWDLFMFTVTETDRLHHFLYDAYEDADHPLHAEFLQFYRDVDALIGDLLRRSRQQGDTEVLMLSDHGFGPVRQEIYINPILQRYGFFSLDTEAGPGRSLEGIGGRAKALAIDPARIFIHLRDKFPRGRVALRDYEKIRGELRELFENYKVNGRKAIRRVFYREELYSPPLRQQAADIVLLANPGFDLKAGADKKEESGLNHFTGMHTQDDAFCFCTRPDLLPDPLTICDVKSVIEKLLAD